MLPRKENNMTIKEFLMNQELEERRARIEQFKELGAPQVIIERLGEKLSKLESGKFKVGGQKELLDEEYKTHQECKGIGGREYLHINGHINYFPRAKYDRYIIEGSKGS
jgi:hypothetical protein